MSHLIHWIEDVDAREICRDAAFLTGVKQNHYLHLGAFITKVADWLKHNIAEEIPPLLYEPGTRH